MAQQFLFSTCGISNPRCTRCERYAKVRHVCVPGEVVGNGEVKLVVVGEAPGQEEDVQNRPFVGPSGKLLRGLLEKFGVTYYVTNSCKCFGPTPTLKEIQACSPYLKEELRLYPQVPVLAVGLIAARALGYKDARMQAIVNTVTYSSQLDRRIGFILHPAAYLRSPVRFKKVWQEAETTIVHLLQEKQRDITKEFQIEYNRLPNKVPSLWTLDTETTGLDMFGSPAAKRQVDPKCNEDEVQLTVIAIYDADTNTAYVLKDKKFIVQSLPTILRWWQQNPPYVHNAKFDLHVLQREALRHRFEVPLVAYQMRDTLVHLALNNPDAPKGLAWNLEAMNVKKYWGNEVKHQVADLGSYAASDAYGVYILRNKHQDVESHPEYLVMQRLTSATQLVERVGIPVSIAHTIQGIAECYSNIEQILQETKLPEEVFRSPSKMGRLLRIDSTDKNSISILIAERPDSDEARLAQKLVEYRKHQKLIGYFNSVKALATKNEFGWDVVHAQFHTVGAAGGRMSSSSFSQHFGLNLQNFPPEARTVFQPPPRFVNMEADYSQIELRVVAMIANVRGMLEAFEKKEDLHAKTAQAVFGEVTPELRRKAKAVNFGFLYGMSAEGFQHYLLGNFRMYISVEEAKAVRQKFFESYPELLQYYKIIEKQVVDRGYVESLFGRRRYFIPTQEQIRAAINFKVQSTAAEICLRSMVTLAETLPGLGAYVVNQVHDSIHFAVPEDKLDVVRNIIESTMSHTQLGVFPVEIKVVRYTPPRQVNFSQKRDFRLFESA